MKKTVLLRLWTLIVLLLIAKSALTQTAANFSVRSATIADSGTVQITTNMGNSFLIKLDKANGQSSSFLIRISPDKKTVGWARSWQPMLKDHDNFNATGQDLVDDIAVWTNGKIQCIINKDSARGVSDWNFRHGSSEIAKFGYTPHFDLNGSFMLFETNNCKLKSAWQAGEKVPEPSWAKGLHQ